MSSSRISSRENLKNKAKDPKKSITLFDGIFRNNSKNKIETKDSEDIIARSEAIARENQKMKKSSKIDGGRREYAQALHRQADLLHDRGDYEMALILYNRAARACPRETSHGVAARRTAAAISLATNPSKPQRKILPKAKNVAQLVGISCPETAAQRAKKIVEESADPVSAIDQILKYFDSRKDFLQDPPIFRDSRRSALISRSRIMLRQLGSLASVTLENLQATFASGEFPETLRIANELLIVAEPLADHYRYEVAARHYLAMAHVSLGRHDRAIDQATWMIKSAKESGDASLQSRAFMTLGRVHLTFRHLDAAARAWEKIVKNVENAVPKAWLLHEIGRCYFEMKRYSTALEMSYRCLEYADEGNSPKWLLHGNLLRGQSLVELGRLGEAVIVLKEARTIAENENDKETRVYISDLMDRITGTLRQIVPTDDVLESNKKSDDKIAEEKIRRAKSDDVSCKESPMIETSLKKSAQLFKNSRLKSKISRLSGKIINSPRNLRRKNCRVLRNKARKISVVKIVKKSVSMSFSEASEFQDGVSKNDNNESKQGKDHSDEAQEELLTTRTRIIQKTNSQKDNLIAKQCDEMKFGSNPGRCFDDDETSNRSGKTYVLDQFL